MNFEGKHILVTGGAGFIGSNLVKKLLEKGAKVTVLDNFLTGKEENIEPFKTNSNFIFINGSITDVETCQKACIGIDAISHQAALGSVPRSIEFPHNSHAVNATGFLNMLHAAKENNVKRFVFASSSSVYGDSTISPKKEGDEGNLLSPYAVTKELNEQYAKVYARLHQMETIGLRYFNVFGPNQDPNGVYAAAIPKFIHKMMNGEEIIVNGDGEQTRDFTFVENAVYANMLALSSTNTDSFGDTFNVACGSNYSLNFILETIKSFLVEHYRYHNSSYITYGPDRPGDIRHSLADISSIENKLGYTALYSFKEGIEKYLKTLI
jgi:UDP-N-acetylglucosamine 4-epimerase